MEDNTLKFAGMNDAEVSTAIRQEVLNAPEGSVCKFASESGTSYIRMRVYEEGFARKILPVQTITNDDLSQFVAGENLGVIVEVEPTQVLSTSVPFDVAAPTEYYWGGRTIVPLFDIKTRDSSTTSSALPPTRWICARSRWTSLSSRSQSRKTGN